MNEFSGPVGPPDNRLGYWGGNRSMRTDEERWRIDPAGELVRSRVAAVFFWGSLFAVFLLPAKALATQGHGGAEGLYVHQLSHLFFCLSMGILMYWLRATQLTRKPGWRSIRVAALLFFLWSVDAFLVHLLDEQLQLVLPQRRGAWTLQIETVSPGNFLAGVYYLAKLDHLLCVPALFCLYRGLKQLAAEGTEEITPDGGPS